MDAAGAASWAIISPSGGFVRDHSFSSSPWRSAPPARFTRRSTRRSPAIRFRLRSSKRGLSVEIKDVVRLPMTRGMRPAEEDVNPSGWARVSFVRDLPDGRRFANDSRGFLYLLDGSKQPTVYANVGALFPLAVYNRLESGFIGFDFHPEFAKNGLFYTVHAERAPGNPADAELRASGIHAGAGDLSQHHYGVARDEPGGEHVRRDQTRAAARRPRRRQSHASVWVCRLQSDGEAGDRRLRAVVYERQRPGLQQRRRTERQQSDADAAAGFGHRRHSQNRSPQPRAVQGTKGLGDYTVPPSNRFAADGDAKTLGEIYAYGFRNAHRLSWDLTDGTMFASDIGMNNVEEVNIVRNGNNYGWMKREGLFENGVTRPGGALNQLFPQPMDILSGKTKDEFTYPVAMYDHDEGQAISGGFAYHGRITALRGKFVFGDVQRGRVFAADLAAMKKADDGIPQTVAPVEEIQLYVVTPAAIAKTSRSGNSSRRPTARPSPRADLHISQSRDGELFITSRQDGVIRMLVPDSAAATAAARR